MRCREALSISDGAGDELGCDGRAIDENYVNGD